MFCCLVSGADPSPEPIARLCSPRVRPIGPDAVVFDASGLARILGEPAEMAQAVVRLAAERGVTVRAAVAPSVTAAWLLARAHAGVTVARPGEEASALAALPLEMLRTLEEVDGRGTDCLLILARWGLRTLGDLARLPRPDLHSRLGPIGARLHQAACGLDAGPFVPCGEPRRYVETLELEWPIESLEPLSFVLARLSDALEAALERADRGAIVVETRLRLVTRELHVRRLHLPAAMRESRVLRTLILLDLESNPPPAGIDVVEVEVEVAPGRIVQGSLLARANLSPETASTLLARLRALAGEDRVGAPAVVDTHDERRFAVVPFASDGRVQGGDDGARGLQTPGIRADGAAESLRRFRLPVPARVHVERGAPAYVQPAARGIPGGRVVSSAGPWHSSGAWWSREAVWDREEWDVEIAASGVYRLTRDRLTGQWQIDAAID
jgi:protein ImuB